MSRKPGRLRAVFDCNTLIQAMAFENGPAGACMELVESGTIELFISRQTMNELRRVVGYPEVLAMNHKITLPYIARFIERLMFRATLTRRVQHVVDYPRDPADEPYIDLAATVLADFLVTRDKDLLSLMSGHSVVCKTFRQKTYPLRIVDPQTFAQIVKAWGINQN